MQCPYCGSDSQVLDSRATTEGVRRRRVCNRCKRRFTTYERPSAPSLKVIKRSDKVEAFDSDKLQHALRRVCRGRASITDEDIRRIARDIEARLLDAGAKSVRSGQIVLLALTRLRELDRLAYNRLAANYLDEAGHLRVEPRPPGPGEELQLGLFVSEEDEPPVGD